VVEEIQELRRRGVRVIPCSARRANMVDPALREFERETLYLGPVSFGLLWRAGRLLVRQRHQIGDLVERILLRGCESLAKRMRTLVHTVLGAYYAAQLRDLGVEHIHVHHGYFASWVALVAARLLGIRFSMTLHGSDLLVHASYLDTKLAECGFCVTISEFNRQHLLAHYPAADPHKIHVQRLGVSVPPLSGSGPAPAEQLVLLAVGRLHAVKNYPFLLQACFRLREKGMNFRCCIAGDGPERRKVEWLIEELRLKDTVTLLGHIPHDEIRHYYRLADLVVLTSHSEGIPLVLMEAMAQGRIVLAPAITGIPELVVEGETGFLYKPGELEDFVSRVEQICKTLASLDRVRQAAHAQVQSRFNQHNNVHQFADLFLRQIARKEIVTTDRSHADENLVLQQI
jgi:colanic acid/amylovoran biosynthesis glycosyltransferase